MLRLLKKELVENAAEHLWKRTEGRPAIQQKVPVYIHRALYWIAWALKDRPKEPSASEYRRIIKSIEQILDDDRLVLFLGRKGEEFKNLTERAADYYRMYESSAERTKQRDMSQRTVLSALRGESRFYFGSPMNQAVSYLMKAAFGGSSKSWDLDTIRVRASEWRC
jgi:hypothetical protein